ncbi:hypothetical protein [Ensifer canadensis]
MSRPERDVSVLTLANDPISHFDLFCKREASEVGQVKDRCPGRGQCLVKKSRRRHGKAQLGECRATKKADRAGLSQWNRDRFCPVFTGCVFAALTTGFVVMISKAA